MPVLKQKTKEMRENETPIFPEAFVREMETDLGEAGAGLLLAALAGPSPVSIRLNRRKGCAVVEGEPVPWCSTGWYLSERPAFTFDPMLHAGAYYVQEASSMFVEQAFRALSVVPRRVLDLCAAPGGKSTLWRSLLPDGALLVANEPLRQRASVLVENLSKWGHPDTVVTQSRPADFAALPGFFDVVAADVPCSGEGMFRKDAVAVAGWSPEAVALCARRQREIVEQVWPALREGGFLVYSTCTFNRAEDEENVAYISRTLGARPVEISVDMSWGVADDARGEWPVCHFYPHRARGEGFFLALLQKTSANASVRQPQRGRDERPQGGGLWRMASSWLRQPDGFSPVTLPDGTLAAVGTELRSDVARLARVTHVLSAGVPLAVERGRKAVPHAALATSLALAPDAFPRVELDVLSAVAYLRRETPQLPASTPRGYVVVTYGGLPLGFLNNLGNRANNLYPAEWRIRSSHMTETPRVVRAEV